MDDDRPLSERARVVTLSQSHVRIIEGLARGLNYRSIAADLFLSPATVAYHVGRLQERLRVSNTAALVAAAFALQVLGTESWPIEATGVLQVDLGKLNPADA